MKLKNTIALITTTILTSTICFASQNNNLSPIKDEKIEQETTPAKTSNHVEIIAPWARPTNPANNNSAAYFQIQNNSDREVNLINVSSDIANKVELHNSYIDEKGVSKMAKVDKLVIPAKGDITLKPGGMHVMLLDLKDKLEVGSRFDLFLYFDDKTQQKITIEVKNSK